jgi:hypothetical protein
MFELTGQFQWLIIYTLIYIYTVLIRQLNVLK